MRTLDNLIRLINEMRRKIITTNHNFIFKYKTLFSFKFLIFLYNNYNFFKFYKIQKYTIVFKFQKHKILKKLYSNYFLNYNIFT